MAQLVKAKREENIPVLSRRLVDSQKMSHSAEKCKRGDPLGFINIYSVAKYHKTRKGDSFETLKNFRKKTHSAEKKLKGGTL